MGKLGSIANRLTYDGTDKCNKLKHTMKATTIRRNFPIIGFLFLLCPIYAQFDQREAQNKYHLIAHRGGVVDDQTAENSLAALRKASKAGYWMVEVDLRLTRDSVPIIHHDPNFKKYYGVDRAVSEMDWDEVRELVGNLGNKVLTFEEALMFCQKNGLQVMVDNKIKGFDANVFGKVLELLKKYDRSEHALMIGTTESTPFFTGKIKLSCTMEQLRDNMSKPGSSPKDYYLFSKSISQEDMEWTKDRGIMAVGAINAWAFKGDTMMEDVGEAVKKLKEVGVDYYQIDSIFDFLFM